MSFLIFTVGMVGTQGPHDPSRYRALVREAKGGRGRHPGKLLDEARRLKSPYYASLALFELSADPRLRLREAASAAGEALATAGRVKRLWRRAELLGIIAKKVNTWRDDREATKSRERLLDRILDAVVSMPEGQGLSDAIKGCAPRLGCNRMGPLLAKAVSNRGFETTDARTVIRQWAQRCKGAGPTLEEVMDALATVETQVVRSRLMGYLHLQCRKFGRSPGSMAPLRAAVEAAVALRKEERLNALRYLAGQTSTRENLEVIAGAFDRIEKEDPSGRAGLMTALGASADRAGLKEMALDWFREGLQESSRVEDPLRRAGIRLNLAKGLGRCDETGLAREAYLAALDDSGDNEKLMGRIRRSMEDQGFKPPEVRKTVDPELKEISRKDKKEKTGQVKGTNNILALYNTYKGGLKPVHLRAVARAAPLCVAFRLDLALMGFPTDDLEGLISQVMTETNIGRGGRYLKELEKQGRIVLVSDTRYGPPGDVKELGLLVATTSHPKEDKKVGMAEAIRLARSRHPLRRMCLIMGLGKKGLPQSLLDAVPYHLELTGSNVPLETCTAMGVIAQQMRSGDG